MLNGFRDVLVVQEAWEVLNFFSLMFKAVGWEVLNLNPLTYVEKRLKNVECL